MARASLAFSLGAHMKLKMCASEVGNIDFSFLNRLINISKHSLASKLPLVLKTSYLKCCNNLGLSFGSYRVTNIINSLSRV